METQSHTECFDIFWDGITELRDGFGLGFFGLGLGLFRFGLEFLGIFYSPLDSKPKQVELKSLEIVEQLKLEVQKIQLVQKELSEQIDKLHNKINRLLV